MVAIIGGFVYVVVSAVIDAGTILVESAPYFIGRSIVTIQEWFQGVMADLPLAVQEQINQSLVSGGVSLGNWISDTVFGSLANIPATFSVILGFAVIPFFLFYILKDAEMLKGSLVNTLPAGVSRHGRNIVNIIEQVLGRYIKAQLMLGLIVGYFSFIGLLLLDAPFPLALALFFLQRPGFCNRLCPVQCEKSRVRGQTSFHRWKSCLKESVLPRRWVDVGSSIVEICNQVSFCKLLVSAQGSDAERTGQCS